MISKSLLCKPVYPRNLGEEKEKFPFVMVVDSRQLGARNLKNILTKRQNKNYNPSTFVVSNHFPSTLLTPHPIEPNWVQPCHYVWQYWYKFILYVRHDSSLYHLWVLSNCLFITLSSLLSKWLNRMSSYFMEYSS